MSTSITKKDIRDSGMAYVAILFVLVIMTTLGLAFVHTVGIKASVSASRGISMQAHYLAESAANHAMWRLLKSTISTADFRVSHDDDDAEEDDHVDHGHMSLDRDKLELGKKSCVGIRFLNVNIPQGATITTAYVEFQAKDSNTEDTELKIRGENTANASRFASDHDDISNRPETSSFVLWSNVPSWSQNQFYKTPELTSIIQEIVDRSDWSSGNAMVVLFQSMNPDGKRQAVSHDKSSANAPLLHVVYGDENSLVENKYYMHSLAGGRYGYKVRRHTETTFATIATVGAVGDSVVHQSYVLYVIPPPAEVATTRTGYILSTMGGATLGGLSFMDEDLVEYDPEAFLSTMFLDGDTVFSSDEDIDAVHVLDDGHIILSTLAQANINGLIFRNEDLVEYDPETDTATMFFDGSAVFSGDEDVDAVHILENGHIVLSTVGGAAIGSLNFADEDLVEYDPGTGTATKFFDGSAVFSGNEDVNAVYILENGNIVLSTTGDATIGSLSFGDDDLVEYDPGAGTATLFFNGGLFSSIYEDIDAFHVAFFIADIDSDLVGHWALDETSGTTAADSSGNGNDGTLTNMNPPTDWVTGKIDGALDFDGDNDSVDAGSDASIGDIFASGGTVSAWIYAEGWGENSFGRIADKSPDTSATSGWSFQLDGSFAKNSLRFESGFGSSFQGAWTTPQNSISLNTWNHVVVVYDSSSPTNDATVYINGTPQTITEAQPSFGTYQSDAAYALRIGNFAGADSRTFDGLIDDVRIYRRALDPAEVQALKNLGN